MCDFTLFSFGLSNERLHRDPDRQKSDHLVVGMTEVHKSEPSPGNP